MIAATTAALALCGAAGYARARGDHLAPQHLLAGAAGLVLGGLATWAEATWR